MGCNPVLSGNCFDCGTYYSKFEGKCPKCGQQWGVGTLKTDLFKLTFADHFWRFAEMLGFVFCTVLMLPIALICSLWHFGIHCVDILQGCGSHDIKEHLKFWAWDNWQQ